MMHVAVDNDLMRDPFEAGNATHGADPGSPPPGGGITMDVRALIDDIVDGEADGALVHLPPGDIAVLDGWNYRRWLDHDEDSALAADVRHRGIIQPVVVRPRPDRAGFWLIAGERRHRAALAAALTSIPAMVRLVSEAEALGIAAAENAQRSDVGPAEEALLAVRALQSTGNDREEAARLLGWSARKLSARLLLQSCAPEVIAALGERRIKLGHAELISSVPSTAQLQLLAAVNAEALSVAALRGRIEGLTLPLSSAIFSLSDCQACPHNCDRQADLFEQHIGSGRCANLACFSAKREEALEARAQALSREFGVARSLSECPPGSWRELLPEGPQGVGAAQFEEGCATCSQRGVVFAPDAAGQSDACFNVGCWTTMVQAHRGADSDAPEAGRETSAATLEATPCTAQAPSPVPLPAIQRASARSVRRGVARWSAHSEGAREALSLFGVWVACGRPALDSLTLAIPSKCNDADALRAFSRLVALGDAAAVTHLHGIMQEHLLVGPAKVGGARERECNALSNALCDGFAIDPSGAFRLDTEFLESLSTGILASVMIEVGAAAAVDGAGGAGCFDRARRQGRAALLAAFQSLDNAQDFFTEMPSIARRALDAMEGARP